MDELSNFLREDAEFRVKLAGGSTEGGQKHIDPDAEDAPDILSAGLGIVPL